MITLTHDVLKKYIDNNKNLASYRKRFCYDDMRNIFLNPHNQKVISLYGLRRTGKTVLMQQLMREINDYDRMCFIQCQYSDDMMDLRSVIEDNDSYETYIEDPLGGFMLWADGYGHAYKWNGSWYESYDSYDNIDSDGNAIKIWYKDKNGNNTYYRFSGFHGQKSIKIPNNQFVKDVISAYVYDTKNGGGKGAV